MQRRTFLTLLSGAGLAYGVSALAQYTKLADATSGKSVEALQRKGVGFDQKVVDGQLLQSCRIRFFAQGGQPVKVDVNRKVEVRY